MRPLCPQCSCQYGHLPQDKPAVPPCGHARCYKCAERKRFRFCSSDCKKIIKLSSLKELTVEYVDLNDENWAAKSASMRNVSQSLDEITLQESHSLLEEERLEVTLSLRNFTACSTFQTAVELLVLEMNEVEEEESKLLREIATATNMLEMLDFKIQAAKSHLSWWREAGVDECDPL